MMRLLVFLSCVGAAIYALLVVTNEQDAGRTRRHKG